MKSKIFAAKDIETEKVECPEWDCTLFVRTMSNKQRKIWLDNDHGKNDPTLTALLIVVACTVDEEGNPVFTVDDIPQLAEKKRWW